MNSNRMGDNERRNSREGLNPRDVDRGPPPQPTRNWHDDMSMTTDMATQATRDRITNKRPAEDEPDTNEHTKKKTNPVILEIEEHLLKAFKIAQSIDHDEPSDIVVNMLT